MSMDDRKRRVLMTIVRLYSNDGEPVGSSLLCRHLDIEVSTATLRNEMAALTRLGLLGQPHTSAGRVPTVEGYRYYLQSIMEEAHNISKADKNQIDRIFESIDYDPEKLIQEAAKEFSDWMECAVVAETPHSDDMQIVHFDSIQIGRFTAALLAVTSAGGLRSRVVKLDEELSTEEAKQIVAVLNHTLRFVSEEDLSISSLYEMATLLGRTAEKSLPILKGALALVNEVGRSRVYFEGQQYFLRWPELKGVLQELMELFSNEKSLRALLDIPANKTIFRFGEDLTPEIPDFSMVSRRYYAGRGLTGALAVAGPTRMRFGEVVPRVEYFTKVLSKHLISASS